MSHVDVRNREYRVKLVVVGTRQSDIGRMLKSWLNHLTAHRSIASVAIARSGQGAQSPLPTELHVRMAGTEQGFALAYEVASLELNSRTRAYKNSIRYRLAGTDTLVVLRDQTGSAAEDEEVSQQLREHLGDAAIGPGGLIAAVVYVHRLTDAALGPVEQQPEKPGGAAVFVASNLEDPTVGSIFLAVANSYRRTARRVTPPVSLYPAADVGRRREKALQLAEASQELRKEILHRSSISQMMSLPERTMPLERLGTGRMLFAAYLLAKRRRTAGNAKDEETLTKLLQRLDAQRQREKESSPAAAALHHTIREFVNAELQNANPSRPGDAAALQQKGRRAQVRQAWTRKEMRDVEVRKHLGDAEWLAMVHAFRGLRRASDEAFEIWRQRPCDTERLQTATALSVRWATSKTLKQESRSRAKQAWHRTIALVAITLAWKQFWVAYGTARRTVYNEDDLEVASSAEIARKWFVNLMRAELSDDLGTEMATDFENEFSVACQLQELFPNAKIDNLPFLPAGPIGLEFMGLKQIVRNLLGERDDTKDVRGKLGALSEGWMALGRGDVETALAFARNQLEQQMNKSDALTLLGAASTCQLETLVGTRDLDGLEDALKEIPTQARLGRKVIDAIVDLALESVEDDRWAAGRLISKLEGQLSLAEHRARMIEIIERSGRDQEAVKVLVDAHRAAPHAYGLADPRGGSVENIVRELLRRMNPAKVLDYLQQINRATLSGPASGLDKPKALALLAIAKTSDVSARFEAIRRAQSHSKGDPEIERALGDAYCGLIITCLNREQRYTNDESRQNLSALLELLEYGRTMGNADAEVLLRRVERPLESTPPQSVSIPPQDSTPKASSLPSQRPPNGARRKK